jgi:hypothetical protein
MNEDEHRTSHRRFLRVSVFSGLLIAASVIV